MWALLSLHLSTAQCRPGLRACPQACERAVPLVDAITAPRGARLGDRPEVVGPLQGRPRPQGPPPAASTSVWVPYLFPEQMRRDTFSQRGPLAKGS